MHRFRLIAAIGLFLVATTPAAAHAFELGNILSGYVMAFDYLDISRPLGEIGFAEGSYNDKPWVSHDRAGLRLQLRLAGDITNDVSFDTSINFQYDVAEAVRQPTSSATDGMSFFFKEGFISVRNILDYFDLKVGRQYVFWGKFEWGGALDIVSGWNYAAMSAEKENFRLAVDAVRLWMNFDPVTIELLVIPVFTPNKMPLELPEKAGPSTVVQNDAALPSTSFVNTEVGAKVAFPLGSDGEMALYYFRGFDRTFSMVVEGKPDDAYIPEDLVFTPTYNSLQVAGIDAEYIAGPVMLLFEGAYFHTEDEDGEDIFVKNKHMKLATGFEWEATSKLSVTGLYSYTRLLQYDRNREWHMVKNPGTPDPYVARTNQHKAMYRLRYYPIQELSLQLMQIFNIPDGDFMTLGFVSWEIVSGLKLYTGLVAFRGPNGTTFGRLEEQSRWFTELKYSF